MGSFESFSLLFELSDEGFTVLNGSVVWEKFGFEGSMVMSRVSCEDGWGPFVPRVYLLLVDAFD